MREQQAMHTEEQTGSHTAGGDLVTTTSTRVEAEPAIRLDGVTMRFPTPTGELYTAVADVDLSVGAGRFVSIVGPSGCGKSTILNAMAGLIPPAAGQVEVFGSRLQGINRRAGYLFQQDALMPWKTVLDNVMLAPRLAREGSAASRREAARAWLSRVGLSGFEDRYPFQLSGGMRKRAAIAQTWIMGPDMLLMDEPFSSLDVQTRLLMENELLELWTGSGTSVVFVTHDLDEAVSLSDEVVLLSAGPASTIVGRFPVDLPRPRDLMCIRADARFTSTYNTIWAALRDEVMKTHERSTQLHH